MQFPGAVIGGPTRHPTTMWLSKQAGSAGPEDPRARPGYLGCQGRWSSSAGPGAWTGLGGRSRLVDPEGACVERWDGKSGHGAESVRHAEMSLAAAGESIGLSGTCQCLDSCGQTICCGRYHCEKFIIIHRAAQHLSYAMCKEERKPTGERVGLAPETGHLGSQQQQATDDVTGLEGLWGPFPDIWCSFGRGIKWLWRSRRNDRQSLFCAYFLQRSATVSLTSPARSFTRSRDCWGCSAGADARWLVAHPPSVHPHPPDHALRNHFLFPATSWGSRRSTGQPSTWVHDGDNSVPYCVPTRW